MYENGMGVTQNYDEAVKYYKLSADQGCVNAQYNLGYMYYNGKGVAQNYDEAAKYYKQAADQGDLQSIKQLEKINNYKNENY
jgi:TPR repeat protein